MMIGQEEYSTYAGGVLKVKGKQPTSSKMIKRLDWTGMSFCKSVNITSQASSATLTEDQHQNGESNANSQIYHDITSLLRTRRRHGLDRSNPV